MFLPVFRFELNYHRRQYLFYVLAGVFFLLSFLATTTPNVSIIGGVQNININAPFTVMATLTSLSLFAVIGAIAFCASGVVRDYDLQVAEIFLSTPVSKFAYVYGRYCGALVFAIGLYVAAALGVYVGEFMPWLDQERIGPTSYAAYWFSTWAIAIPNILIASGIFFFVSTVTRSTMATYVALVALLILNAVVSSFTERETVELTSLLDPFGGTALQEVTRYWTVFEKNELIPALEGALLTNRAVWLGVGGAFLAGAYFFYPFSLEAGIHAKKKSKVIESQKDFGASFHELALPTVNKSFDFSSQLTQYFSQTRLEIRNIVFSVPFAVIMLIGLFSVTGNALANLGNIFGTAVYPTTAILVNIINGAFSISLLAVLVYYSGELMAREKTVRIDEIVDAMPYPNWVMMAAKLSGLVVVIVAMLMSAMLAGIGVQIYREFYEFNVGQYLVGLLWFFQFPLYFMAVLAVFFYTVTRNKYFAMFLMILYFLYQLAAPQLGFEHYLYRMSQVGTPWSDFTGYAQNLTPYLWQTLYWSLFGVLMLVAIHLLWPRGSEDDWANRMKVMRQRINSNVVLMLWGTSTLFVLTGAWIFYNTNILNDYVTSEDTERFQADYERKYKQYENLPQPVITDVYAEVDIFPDRRDVHLRGRYQLQNLADEAISQFHVVHFAYLDIESLDIPGATLESFDEELGYRVYSLEAPMLPGTTREVAFEVAWLTPGFANNGHGVKVTPNGTFFNTLDIFPLFGYRNDFELQDNSTRREHDLPPLERMAKIEDESAWIRTFLGDTRVHFETIVSTKADQIALAPGYLQKEWMEDGRHYFHYKMDEPIWNLYSYLSGEYQVKKDAWNDIAVEVYYLHDYNVDTMIRSTKNSLDYFERNFSPYQYSQFRILEFPRYQGAFAQSFPNTIPFSEAIGFVADLRDPEEIDYVYYVTAHELAHQWWAHQVLGADVQGQTMIVETLAQYSALMVMEEEYGPEHMKRFLEFELDRYLADRGGELIDEMPLFLVENQPYIHYRKGSVVLYALKDYIGEEKINRALSRFIAEYAFKGPPYPTTKHLIAYIREEAPDEYDDFITDLVEKIVLYDLRVAESSVKELDDGGYEVTFDVTARKFEADGAGQETEVPIAGWFDIGVLGEEQGESKVPEVLHLEKYEITANEQSFTIVVDKKPVSVGIDPFNKMIDRNPSDNIEKI